MIIEATTKNKVGFDTYVSIFNIFSTEEITKMVFKVLEVIGRELLGITFIDQLVEGWALFQRFITRGKTEEKKTGSE